MELETTITAYLNQVIDDVNLEHLVPAIASRFAPLELKKNKFLVEAGEICPYFCFIEQGILQHYIIVSGEEKTTNLALENSCTSALNSFKNQLPARKGVKAISDCALQVMDLTTFKDLMETNSAFYIFYHNLIEQQIFLIDDYRIDLITLTPEERYQKLLANQPNIVQQVPLRYLASFLGISTRHMSRIRKNTI